MELSIGLLLVTIAKIQEFLFRPDNMPRSTHKCLNPSLVDNQLRLDMEAGVIGFGVHVRM